MLHMGWLHLYPHILFRVGATLEMIELNTEKCIFQLIKITAAQRLLSGRERSKVAERQRERECVCVRLLVETADSVDQHPQTTWVEKHMGNIFRHKECGFD
jgi:hypothetical protein